MNALLAGLSLFVVAQTNARPVSFDLRPLAEQDYRRLDGLELERKVALRLIQEGFAVVSRDSASAEFRLGVRREGKFLVLESAGEGPSPSQRVQLDGGPKGAP